MLKIKNGKIIAFKEVEYKNERGPFKLYKCAIELEDDVGIIHLTPNDFAKIQKNEFYLCVIKGENNVYKPIE